MSLNVLVNGIPPPEKMQSGRPSQGNDRYYHLIRLAPILVVYFALAFYRIGHQSLWVDEVLSLERVAPDGPLFTRTIWFRGQGPLYFVFLHLWAKLATSEAALRSLSVLFGGIAVCFVYAIGLRLRTQRVAWIGALLFATSPFLIWYSQETRYITLMIAASLVAMYAFLQILSVDRFKGWVLYGSSVVVAFAAFIVNIFLPVVQGLYVLSSRAHRPLLKKWVVCQIIVFSLILWWVNGGQVSHLGGFCLRLFNEITVTDKQEIDRASRLSTGGSRETTLAVLPYTFFAFSTGFSMGPSLEELHVSRSLKALLSYAWSLASLALLFGGLFLSGLIALRHHPSTMMLLTLWLSIPLIGVFGISTFTDMAYNVRYVAMTVPVYLLILAEGITRSQRPLVRTALLAAVLAVNGFSLFNYYFNDRYAREDARSAVQYLESVSQPQDFILCIGIRTALQYYNVKDLPITLWGKSITSDRSIITERLHELENDYSRIWLVMIRPWQTDPRGQVKASLDAAYPVVRHKQFAGVDIYCYQLTREHPHEKPSHNYVVTSPGRGGTEYSPANNLSV